MFVIAKKTIDAHVDGLFPMQSDYERDWEGSGKDGVANFKRDSCGESKKRSRSNYRNKWYRNLKKIKKCFRSPMRSGGLKKFDLARYYSRVR